MNKYYIPKYLDEPFKLIFFTLDEIIAFCAPLLLSMMYLGSPIFGIVIGSIFVSIVKKLKGKQGHSQFLRFIYWYFPPFIRFKSTPPSYVREILG